MDDQELRPITLADLAGQAAGERWAHEFERLLDNALDLNRDATAKRSIMLKIEVKPNEKRNGGTMSIVVDSRLAPLSEVSEQIHFGRHAITGMPVAVQFDPGQHDMFRSDSPSVIPISQAAEGRVQ
jgi:hypothetical protein